MSAPEGVRPITPEYARHLTLPKRAFLEPDESPRQLIQVGGAYIGGEIELPAAPDPAPGGSIETFAIGGDLSCEPLGANMAVIETFASTARLLAGLLLDALHKYGVAIVFPGFLTVATTPVSAVSSLPHFDDEHYEPLDGVGVVAVLATRDGTRVARNNVPITSASDGFPLDLPGSTIDGFWSEDVDKQVASPGRLLVMPQFGQLHAGPPIASHETEGNRTTFVIRFGTIPADAGSIPKEPAANR